jgi:hypothetical protein
MLSPRRQQPFSVHYHSVDGRKQMMATLPLHFLCHAATIGQAILESSDAEPSFTQVEVFHSELTRGRVTQGHRL